MRIRLFRENPLFSKRLNFRLRIVMLSRVGFAPPLAYRVLIRASNTAAATRRRHPRGSVTVVTACELCQDRFRHAMVRRLSRDRHLARTTGYDRARKLS